MDNPASDVHAAPASSGDRNVLSDIKVLRGRARQHIERGAVTTDYNADRNAIINLLNEALATEIVCVLRYKRHYCMAQGPHAAAAKKELAEHAKDELGHADRIAERIVQLGGAPDFSPDGLSERSHAEYAEGHSLRGMMQEDPVAERIAIESYREMILFVGERDPTTRRLLEDILAKEEEHADDITSLMFVDTNAASVRNA
jgi:bacterioferritin